MTQCNTLSYSFQPLGSRDVLGVFDGGKVTSDAGGLFLREFEKRFGFVSQFSSCFNDYRDPERVEHTILDLVGQRVFGLCLGYEDLIDHDYLRHDPMLATMVGKTDPLGESRLSPKDRGKALAGKSTLNRLELTPAGAGADSRYKKIVAKIANPCKTTLFTS